MFLLYVKRQDLTSAGTVAILYLCYNIVSVHSVPVTGKNPCKWIFTCYWNVFVQDLAVNAKSCVNSKIIFTCPTQDTPSLLRPKNSLFPRSWICAIIGNII